MRGLVALLLVTMVLAGCSGKEPAAVPAGTDALAKRIDGAASAAAVEVQGPALQVGHRFRTESVSGDQTIEFDIVVAGDTGSGWMLGTTSDSVAKHDAAFDHPLLGAMAKADLSGTGWGGEWRLLQFPLRDGANWTGSMPNIAFDTIDSDTVSLDLHAAYAGDGTYAGRTGPVYRIVGIAQGLVVIEADYAPELGWWSRLQVNDIDSASDEDVDPVEVLWTLKEFSTNATGELPRYEASLLLSHRDGIGFDNDPSQGGQPFVDPRPYASFTVPQEATHVYGWLAAGAAFGARHGYLVPPDNQPREIQAIAPVGFAQHMMPIDEPAIPGEWRLASAGAGGFSGMRGEIYAMTAVPLVVGA